MILSEDKEVKKQAVDDIDQLPLTVELLKSLGHDTYEFNPHAIRRTINIHLNYKHPRKYGYFKEKCGKLKDDILLFGELDKKEHITIKTTAYIGGQSIGVILETLGDLKKYMEIRMAEENIEAERYHLNQIIKSIEIPF